MKIGIIDYGVGNLGSLSRALQEVGAFPCKVDKALDIHNVDKIILPGVGNFTECKKILDKDGWTCAIKEEVLVRKKSILGICLGMQLLSNSSQEGALDAACPTRGLELIPGYVTNLKKMGCNERLPHIGWNSISLHKNSALIDGIADSTDFYFVHSYGYILEDKDICVATTNYEIDIPALVNYRNIWGTQFHPEKSSKAGLKILKNFVWGLEC